MPNHVHLLLRIDCGRRTAAGSGTGNPSPTMGSVIGWFKYVATKEINRIEMKTGPFWQRSYYDHVIRDENDYLLRWNYIDGNPSRWTEDAYYEAKEES